MRASKAKKRKMQKRKARKRDFKKRLNIVKNNVPNDLKMPAEKLLFPQGIGVHKHQASKKD